MDERRHVPSRPAPPACSAGSVRLGQAVARVEDERFLRGGSRFVSDVIAMSKALHVKIVRSHHAHARILAIDTSSARALPGVVDVLTAIDVTNIQSS